MAEEIDKSVPRLTSVLEEQEIVAVVRRFYKKVYAHPQLIPLFEGVEQHRQEKRLVSFIKMTRGVSNPFDGAFLETAHARLPITEALFQLRESLLEAAIREEGHGQEIVESWRQYDELWRVYVIGQ